MSIMTSSAVSAGDDINASDHNTIRDDILYTGGDYAATTNSSNDYSVTLDSGVDSYVQGMKIRVKFNANNTGAATINVNSLGAKTIKKNATVDVAADEIINGGIYDLTYDGTNFQISGVPVDGLPLSASQGDILYYNGSSWTSLPAGNDGEFLQTNGAGANPAWAANSPLFIPISDDIATNACWTDDFNYLCAQVSNNYKLVNISGNNTYYKSGTAQQIARTSIDATATSQKYTPMIYDGYCYVSMEDGSASLLYRCSVTADFSNAANWQQLTVSGTTLGRFVGWVGHDGTNFWIADASNTQYSKFTLSGTTLTHVADVTVTGANYNGNYTRVNGNGIMAYFLSAPHLRFAALDGTLDGNKQVIFTNSYGCFGTPNDFYRPVYDAAATFYGFGLIGLFR